MTFFAKTILFKYFDKHCDLELTSDDVAWMDASDAEEGYQMRSIFTTLDSKNTFSFATLLKFVDVLLPSMENT